MSDQLGAGRGPAVRQQVIELLDRALSDPREHVLEPGERVHLRQFARGNETPYPSHKHPSAGDNELLSQSVIGYARA
jgi:hypothetical protein